MSTATKNVRKQAKRLGYRLVIGGSRKNGKWYYLESIHNPLKEEQKGPFPGLAAICDYLDAENRREVNKVKAHFIP